MTRIMSFVLSAALCGCALQGGKHTPAARGAITASAAAPTAAAAFYPSTYQIPLSGATLENAALLHRAGVKIAFSLTDTSPHNIRKVRQVAGIAVAHGLPAEDALAALTRNPAEIFGVADRNGTLEHGHTADLVLWSGDPLEVTTLADAVFVQGVPQAMSSRQTELRDRYLPKLRANAAR